MSTDLQLEVFTRLGKIAMIGGGRMGEAIVAGLVEGALLSHDAIVIAEPDATRRELLTRTYGVECVEEGAQITDVQTAIIAVKPQVFKEVAQALAASSLFKPDRIISIAAGITTQTIASIFPNRQVIRVMPNAPLAVSTGMSVVAVAEGTQISEGQLTVELFSLMGEAILVEERLINAATAISGSGPAYFALFVEALTAAGTRIGLSQEQASQMALQTLLGTSRQLHLTGQSPEELRRAVTSPGGTTQAALESFDNDGFTTMVEKAVRAAYDRAEELA